MPKSDDLKINMSCLSPELNGFEMDTQRDLAIGAS